MPKTFSELSFHPSIEELQTLQEDRKVTILTGTNNSGKSAYLKKFSEKENVLYMGPSRFYSFHYMSPYSQDPNEIANMRQNMNHQRNSQYSNFEGLFYDTNKAMTRLSNVRRKKLFDLFEELFGIPISVKPEFPENEMSQRYVDIGGDSLSVTSSGTRLFLGILAAMMDERFKVVAIDEPELGLSPTLQARLAPIIVDRERDEELFPHNPRFFISTHGHLFLDKKNPSNNFIVRKDGSRIRAERCQDRAQLLDIQFRMLGNDLSSLFLPDAILFAEGETDQLYLQRVIQLKLEKQKIVVEKCSGDLSSRLNAWSNTLGDLQSGPYRNRTFIITDSVMQSGLERVINRLCIPPESIVRWKGNGIEYVYPLSLLSLAFGGTVNSHTELIMDGDRVSACGITHTKMQLAKIVTDNLRSDTDVPDELTRQLLEPIRQSILPD